MADSRCSERLDLHNVATHFPAAASGRCGFIHLASGRVCLLPQRHRGPCELREGTQVVRSRRVRNAASQRERGSAERG